MGNFTTVKTEETTHAVGFNFDNSFVIEANEVASFIKANPESQTTFRYYFSEEDANREANNHNKGYAK